MKVKEASSSVVLTTDLHMPIEQVLMEKLTNGSSIDAYAKRVEGAIDRSVEISNTLLDVNRSLNEMKARLNMLEGADSDQGRLISSLSVDLGHAFCDFTEHSEQIKTLQDDLTGLTDACDLSKRELSELCEELRQYKDQQKLILEGFHARLNNLEEFRRLDNVDRGTNNTSEINSYREGFQACAMYMAIRGLLPRCLLYDRSFTDMLKDRDELLWALNENDIRRGRYLDPPRYQPESRGPLWDQPPSSPPASEGRRPPY